MARPRRKKLSRYNEPTTYMPAPSADVDLGETQPPSQDKTLEIEGFTSNANSSRLRRGRGKSIGLRITTHCAKRLPPPRITFNNGKTRPVDEWAKEFATEIGVTCRGLAPIVVGSYRKMTATQKEPLYRRLQELFEIDFEAPNVKQSIDDFFAARFRAWKYRMHCHFKKHKTNIEAARNDPYPGVLIKDWHDVCDMFQSSEFKRRSVANRDNRKRLKTNHCAGSKSFARLRFELTNKTTQEEPDMLAFYKETHYRKSTNTWTTPLCGELYAKMELKRNNRVTDLSTPEEVVQITNEIVSEVLGQKSNTYITGLGQDYRGPTSSQHKLVNIEEVCRNAEEAQQRAANLEMQLEKKMQEHTRQMEDQKKHIQSQNLTIAKLQNCVDQLQSMMQQFMAGRPSFIETQTSESSENSSTS